MTIKLWVLVLAIGSGEVLDTFDTKNQCEKKRIGYIAKNPGYKIECMRVTYE